MKLSLSFLLFCCSLQIIAQNNAVGLKELFQDTSSFPLITGHRGGFYEDLPENSLATFDYTVKQSCKLPIVLELDIKASKEGTLFVFHDDSLHRMTNGQGKIAESTDEYLKSLFLKNQKGEITKEKIPTFDSVLYFAKDKKVLLMIDVKAKIWEKVITLIQKHHLIEKCIILTFKDEDAKLAYQLDTTSLISVLVNDEITWKTTKNLKIPFQNLIAYINQNTPKQIIQELGRNKIPMMTDVSENRNKNTKPLEAFFYKNLFKNKKLNILITDFPVAVSAIFCEK